MVTDRSTRIGCAMARYTQPDGWKSTLITCNYSFTNIMSQPIYLVVVAVQRTKVFVGLKIKNKNTDVIAPLYSNISTNQIPMWLNVNLFLFH
jgi:hypothetical protein